MEKIEYVINNSSILDLNLSDKINIEANKNDNAGFSLEIQFHFMQIEDYSKINEVDLESSVKLKDKDKIYEILSYQQKKIAEYIKEKNYNICDITARGKSLASDDSVIIIIEALKSDDRRIISNANTTSGDIIPNEDRLKKNLLDYMQKIMEEKYYELMKGLRGHKKIMSDLLGVEPTDDQNALFTEFYKQYQSTFFFNTQAETERKIELLREKIKEAVLKQMQ